MTQVIVNNRASFYAPPILFYVMGKDYLKYAKNAKKPRGRKSLVLFFLYCHSVELLMKAWLSAKGLKNNVLSSSNFGHNLELLLEECLKFDIESAVKITPQRKEQILKANKYHCMKRKLNYGDLPLALKAYPDLPDIRILKGFCEILIKKIHPTVISAPNPND